MSEESIAIALNHEKSRVNEIVPQYLRTSTDNVIKFLKEYYDYLNDDSQSTSTRLKRLVIENDIDETSSKYLDAIQTEIAQSIPNSDYLDRTTLYKRIIHFYRSKGTKESVTSFFRIFFNDVNDLEIVYGDKPWTYKIRSTKFTTEWKERYKKLVHPAGLKFSAALLFDAIVRGGSTEGGDNPENDPTKIKAGWDPDFWGKRMESYDYYDSLAGGSQLENTNWYKDLVPPYYRDGDSQYTAFFLSKYSPLVDPRIKKPVFTKGSKRWQDSQGGIWDNKFSYNSGDTFFDSSYDSQLGIPPEVDSQQADVKFILSANVLDSRDTFVRQRLQGEIKYFDPTEISSFGNDTFESLAASYSATQNRQQLNNVGISIATIPFTLRIKNFITDSQVTRINEGESVTFNLQSSADFENQKLSYTQEGTRSADSQTVGSNSFFARPFKFNNTWSIGDKTRYLTVDDATAFNDVYLASANTNFAGIPIVVRDLGSLNSNRNAYVDGVTRHEPWAFGMYADGKIQNIFIIDGGASFTPITATELEDSQDLKHAEILFGTLYDSDTAYNAGDQFVSANNLYQVTSGTHTPTDDYPDFGTAFDDSDTFSGMSLKYKGKAARAFISATGDPTVGDISTIQFKTDSQGSVLNGEGYFPIHPTGSDSQYDRSRFRRSKIVSTDYYAPDDTADTYYNTQWQQDVASPRPWSTNFSGTEDLDSQLQWISQGVQKTNGGSSVIKFEFPSDSQLGEDSQDNIVKIRLDEYNTVVKQLIVDDGFVTTMTATYSSPASESDQSAVDFNLTFNPHSNDMDSQIPWAIEFTGSADSQDFNSALSGDLTRTNNTTDNIELDIASDYYTEGTESFKIVIGSPWSRSHTTTYNAGDFIYHGDNLYISVSPDGTSPTGDDADPTHTSLTETVMGVLLSYIDDSKYTININDTFLTPTVDFVDTDSESDGTIIMSVGQGSTDNTFTLSTTNIKNGDTIPFTLTKDDNSDDIITAISPESGDFIINNNVGNSPTVSFTYEDPGSQLSDDNQTVTLTLGTEYDTGQSYVSGDFIRNSSTNELYVVGNDGTSSGSAPNGDGTHIVGGIRYTRVLDNAVKTITVVNQD